jgi:hypothetical protein
VNLSPKIGANQFSFVYTKQFDVNGRTPSWYANVATNWQMDLPQARVEYVSPNTYYDQYLEKVSDLPGKTSPSIFYYGPWESWGIGQKVSEVWNRALSTSLYGYTDPSYGYVEFYGNAFMDSYQHGFQEYDRYPAGTISILKGAQTLVSNQQIGDFYDYWFYTGAGTYTVNIDGTNNQALSMHTIASFTLNVPSALGDVYAPMILFRPQGLDLNNSMSAGNVVVDIGVADPNSVTSLTLQYSINDGSTWSSVTLVPTGGNWYSGNLGFLQNVYVSLKATASDSAGNTVTQTTMRVFHISPASTTSVSSVGGDVVNAAAGSVVYVLPDWQSSHTKPAGVITAALSDFTALGFMFGASSNTQIMALDTNSTYFDSSTGAPKISNGVLVVFAGPIVNGVVHYYEGVGVSPLRFQYITVGGTQYYALYDRQGNVAASMPASAGQAGTSDMFLLEYFRDANNNRVFIIYGFAWKGTYVGGLFFKTYVLPNLASYTHGWYIYQWSDVNGNGLPDLYEVNTTPVKYGD